MASSKAIVNPRLAIDPADQQLKKSGFATKLLQTIYLPGKRGPTSPTATTKNANFHELNEESQVRRTIFDANFTTDESIADVADACRRRSSIS